jgi:hypothetical protein
MQSLNRYAYALNNHTTLTDSLGLQSGGPCGNLQYGEGKGLCQTDVNGVIAAATALGPSSWDPFELMDVPVVVNTGVYVPPFLGSPGEDVSTTGSFDEQTYGGSSELLGVNPMPGYFITPTVGNALTLFGGQLVQPLGGGGGGSPAQPTNPSSSSWVTKPPIGSKWRPSTNTSSCAIYPPGSLPRSVCGSAGNSPQANSIRGCLQQFYFPGSGYLPLLSTTPAVAPSPNLNFLEGLDQQVGFDEDAYCLPEGFLNP